MFAFIDMIIVRPIVNLLFVIYNYVGDFGLAIIIFTILVKVAMWPLVKKQLHQTRLMKKLQPEIAEIKKNCKGNRQLESLQTMDLYKRNNVKPFRSILTLIIQLPIFIALFTSIRVIISPKPDFSVEHYAYSFVRPLDQIESLATTQNTYLEELETFNSREEKQDDDVPPTLDFYPKLFGLVDLSTSAGFASPSSITLLIFALASAFGQYWMARQQNPTDKKRRTFKQIMKDTAAGKQADQSELNAVVSGQMTKIMPIMMLFIMINLPGALVFYYMMSNFVTIAQQRIVLNKSYDQMEIAADKTLIKELNKIEEAEIIDNKKSKQNITRIKASNKKGKRK